MAKPNISLPEEAQEVETFEGMVQISPTSLNKLLSGQINPKKADKGVFEKIGIILGVIVGIVAVIGTVWKIASWVTKNDLKIEQLEKKAQIVSPQILPLLPKQTKSKLVIPEKPVKTKDVLQTSKYKIAELGVINSRIIKTDSTTSFNLPYLLDRNICEYNVRFNNWDSTNPEPKALFFYRLTNTRANLSSWCIVVGKFKNTDTPNRAFIVSEKLANDLGFSLKKGVANIKYCRMNENEWCSNEECLETRKILIEKKISGIQLTQQIN